MTRVPSPYSLPGGLAAVRQQQRTTGMPDLPMKPRIQGPPEKPQRKRGPRKATQRRIAQRQPRDKSGRFAEKPGIFTRAFDGIERAQKTVKKIHRIARGSKKSRLPVGYTKHRRVARKRIAPAPQPNYRKSVRGQLWSMVTGLFRRKR